MSTFNAHIAWNRGFTLIEVLVAVFVLALGLLGLAALQAASLRNNQTAYLRSKATNLAYLMADRMRANRLGVQIGAYHNQQGSSVDCDDASDEYGEAASDGQDCGISEMAAYDLQHWATALTTEMPGGGGVVCLDGTPGDGTAAAPACDGIGPTYAIKVWWNEKVPGSEDSSGTVTRRFVTSFQP